MNLVQLREKFREVSGRYDLVNDDFSDNGADFYITEASKWLDRAIETTKSWGTYLVSITAGTWYVKVPLSRAIKEAWITTAEGKWQLEKKRLQDLIAAFYTELPANWTNGTPEYYSPTITRYIPEDMTAVSLAVFAASVGVLDQPHMEYNALIMSAPVDQAAVVEVHGLFYSFPLSLDDDENYWSVHHPLLLIQAAVRQTYILSGNKPLSEIYGQNINDDLGRIDKELVEQIISEIDEMDG
jgi:hypothetical protein